MIKRTQYNDTIRANKGEVSVFRSTEGEITLNVGKSSLTIYVTPDRTVHGATASLRDLHTVIGELLTEYDSRGDRT